MQQVMTSRPRDECVVMKVVTEAGKVIPRMVTVKLTLGIKQGLNNTQIK